MLGLALHAQQLHVARVRRNRNTYLDLLANQRWLEVRLDHHLDLHLGSTDLTYERYDAKRQADILRRAIPHQFEFAIGWNERDRMLGFELR